VLVSVELIYLTQSWIQRLDLLLEFGFVDQTPTLREDFDVGVCRGDQLVSKRYTPPPARASIVIDAQVSQRREQPPFEPITL
jgi:hypothetical protein